MKKLTTLLAVLMVISILFLCSCAIPSTSSTYVTDANGNIVTNSNGEAVTTPNNSQNSQYSELLNNVINDSYYKSLLNKLTNHEIANVNSPNYDPHPYAFLEDEGININKIKDGTYDAYSMSFVLDEEPNNLYIHTRVLVDDSYYVSYLITYNLTDKEMDEYKTLHGNHSSHSYSIYAFFLNDKISQMKKPTEVLEAKYTKNIHESFSKYANRIVPTKDYIVPEFNLSDKNYLFILYPKFYNTSSATNKLDIKFAKAHDSNIESKNNIIVSFSGVEYSISLGYEDKSATAFFTQDVSIGNSKDIASIYENVSQ